MRTQMAASFSSPPADRMAGRAQARAVRAQARAAQLSSAKPKGNYTPKQKVSAATEARVEQFLDGEQVLDQAVHQAIIAPSVRPHYAQLMKADPVGTRAHLEALGVTSGSGQPAAAQASGDEYCESALTHAERTRIAAAREGQAAQGFVHGGL
jgi:hypothetical protein